MCLYPATVFCSPLPVVAGRQEYVQRFERRPVPLLVSEPRFVSHCSVRSYNFIEWLLY